MIFEASLSNSGIIDKVTFSAAFVRLKSHRQVMVRAWPFLKRANCLALSTAGQRATWVSILALMKLTSSRNASMCYNTSIYMQHY